MRVEFVPINARMHKDVASVERDAYQLHTGLFDECKELKMALGQRAAKQYSFLLRNGDYKGFCIASLQDSVVERERNTEALYISDFAVRRQSQGFYYGLAMAEELLRRAEATNIKRIEFNALGSTSYRAISDSSHTNTFLERYGYRLNEVGGSDIYSPDGKWEESLHLISVEKIAPHHL